MDFAEVGVSGLKVAVLVLPGVPGLSSTGPESRSIGLSWARLFFLAALLGTSLMTFFSGGSVGGATLSSTGTPDEDLGLDSDPSPITANSPCSPDTGAFPVDFEPPSRDQKAQVEPADGGGACDAVAGGASTMVTPSSRLAAGSPEDATASELFDPTSGVGVPYHKPNHELDWGLGCAQLGGWG